MNRAAFYIDGFNLYHSIIGDARTKACRWLDLRKFCEAIIEPGHTLERITYFTAVPPWNAGKARRHRTYLQALRSTGVRIVEGRFQETEGSCRGSCKEVFRIYEEKETDVNISSCVIDDAFNDVFDWVYLVTGDSDQVPTIEMVRRLKKGQKSYCVFPPRRHSADLKQRADRHKQLGRGPFLNSQFPVEMHLPGGVVIRCPATWQSGPETGSVSPAT